MKLVYAKTISDKIIEIPIIGAIGEVVNGDYVAADIAFINQNKSCEQINLRINTEGGNVLNGVKIIGAILNSSIPVHAYNDGIAYSMGFYIWLSAKKSNRHAAFFSSSMIHAARFLDDEDQIISEDKLNNEDKVYLKVINDTLSGLTVETTGKSKEEVLKSMSKDTFYTADDLSKYGFMDKSNIIKYDQMPQISAEMPIQEKINKIAAFYSDNNKQNNKKMELKALALEMGLNQEASVDSFVAKHRDMVAELKEAKDTVADLKESEEKNVSAIKELEKNTKDLESKIEKFEEKEAELKAEVVKTKVDEAIKEGKFKEEDREELNAMAIENPVIFDKFVAKAQVKHNVQAPDISAQLQGDQMSEIAIRVGVKAENMDYDYLWRHEPDKLEAIKAEAPKLHEALKARWIKENN